MSTETSLTERNADGGYTTRVYAGPVNYLDEAGEWAPISNELVPAPGPDYAVRNEANSYVVSIPEDPADTPVRFETQQGWVSMKLMGADEAEPEVEGAVATFYDAAPAADAITYEATAVGVKESILLDSAPSTAPIYRYTLRVGGGILPVLVGQTVEFRKGGSVAFAIPAGAMFDSTSPEPAYSSQVQYTLSPLGDAWRLTVAPDFAWLTDPARVYPVTVDPSVTRSVQKTCWLQEESPTTTHCGEGIAKAGANNSLKRRRALLDFNLNGLPPSADITDAWARLWLDAGATAGDGGATSYALYQPGKSWSNGATWNTPSSGQSWIGGGNGLQISSGTLSLGGENSGWKSWNITGAVRNWLAPGGQTQGVLIRQTTENVKRTLGFVSDASWDYPHWPYLDVTYRVAPEIQSLSVTPCDAPCYPDLLIAQSASPTVLARATDQDGGSLSYALTIRNMRTKAVVATRSASSNAGNTVSWPLATGVLLRDTDYQARISVSDGTSNVVGPWRPLNLSLTSAPLAYSPALSPCAPCSGTVTTTSLNPVLEVAASDADSAEVTSWFEVRNVQGIVYSGSGTVAPSGGVASYSIVSNGLSNGGSYEFRARVTDADGLSAWTDWRAFSVQATGPSEPTFNGVTPCSDTCSLLRTPSLSPTFSATNADTVGRDIVFELRFLDFTTTETFSNVPSGGTVAWTVPSGTLSNGTKDVRIGARAGASTTWTAWNQVGVDAPPEALTDFPTDSQAETEPDGSPQEMQDAAKPYHVDETLNDEDEGDAPVLTQSEALELNRNYFAPRTAAIAEDLEVVRTYAPVLTFDAGEKHYPLSAKSFVNTSVLYWQHACQRRHRMDSDPVALRLGSGGYEHREGNPFTPDTPCPNGKTSNWWKSNAQGVRPFAPGGPADMEGMALNLPDTFRDGGYRDRKTFKENEPVYYRYVKNQYIAYYFLYGESEAAYIPYFSEHEGDWETFWVLLDPDTNEAYAGVYAQHDGACKLPWGIVPKWNFTEDHPEIYVARHGHASYPPGFKVHVYDDASGDGKTWFAARKLKRAIDEDWDGYSGGWGEVNDHGAVGGPEGPDAFKGAPDPNAGKCELPGQ